MKLCTTVIDIHRPEELATFNGYYWNLGRRWAVIKSGRSVRKIPADRVKRVYAKSVLKPSCKRPWTRERTRDLLRAAGATMSEVEYLAKMGGLTVHQVLDTFAEDFTPMPRTRVVHCRREPYDVYIGRANGPRGKWGNPFSHLPNTLAEFRVSSREEALEKYEQWIVQQPELIAALHELKGKRLGCFCKPLACHGDILARLADTMEV